MSPRARFGFLAAVVLAAAVCVRLGFWQLDRLEQRRAYIARVLAAREAPIVDLGGGVVELDAAGHVDDLAYRRVRVAGAYDHDREMLLRGQALRQQPGVHVVTPLRAERGDTAYLVDRGFVPAPDATSADVDSLREPGPVEVVGTAIPLDSLEDGGQPLEVNGMLTWRRLDLAAIRSRLPYPVAPILILQAPDSALPRLPQRVEPPAPGDGPHLSYAIQWFSFATIALITGAIIAFRRRGRAGGGPPPVP